MKLGACISKGLEAGIVADSRLGASYHFPSNTAQVWTGRVGVDGASSVDTEVKQCNCNQLAKASQNVFLVLYHIPTPLLCNNVDGIFIEVYD
jgi:hypothetical protein